MLKLMRLTICAMCFPIAAAGVAATSAQFPASNPQRIQRDFETTVSASGPWQDAGAFIEVGQRVTIQAFGTWRDRAGSTDANGRVSQLVNGRDGDAAMPGAPVMLLVGKIGADGVPFRVGGQTQFLSPRQGRLFLMANSRFATLGDNRGTMTVRIVTTRAIPTPSRGSQARRDQFETNVGARDLWQDSGLFVEAGQHLMIQASGTWRDRGGTTDVNGRPSQILNGRRDELALAGAPAMMLVGKVGDDGVPFRIGTETELTASRPGQLLLMANDRYDALGDNRGTVEVRIIMPRAPAPRFGTRRGSPRGPRRGAVRDDGCREGIVAGFGRLPRGRSARHHLEFGHMGRRSRHERCQRPPVPGPGRASERGRAARCARHAARWEDRRGRPSIPDRERVAVDRAALWPALPHGQRPVRHAL